MSISLWAGTSRRVRNDAARGAMQGRKKRMCQRGLTHPWCRQGRLQAPSTTSPSQQRSRDPRWRNFLESTGQGGPLGTPSPGTLCTRPSLLGGGCSSPRGCSLVCTSTPTLWRWRPGSAPQRCPDGGRRQPLPRATRALPPCPAMQGRCQVTRREGGGEGTAAAWVSQEGAKGPRAKEAGGGGDSGHRQERRRACLHP